MTCIAWSNGYLAADRNTAVGYLSEWEEQKIFKINGYLFGFSGHTTVRDAVITWLMNDKDPAKLPDLGSNNDFSIIVIDCISKKVYYYENNLQETEIPYHVPVTLGSLAYPAKGALIVGATAEEAVQAALRTFKLRPEAKFHTVDVLKAEMVPDLEKLNATQNLAN